MAADSVVDSAYIHCLRFTLDSTRSTCITVDHLLTHRTGLSTFTGNSGHVVDNGSSGPAAPADTNLAFAVTATGVG